MKKKNIVIIVTLALCIVAQVSAFPGMHGSQKSNYSVPEGMDLTNLNIADGVYEGEAVGFREGLVVEVTVKDGEVTDIVVVDHNEVGRRYYQRPIDLIPGEILKEANTEVDVVSGATCTSYGIMAAVENALKAAE